ncbi:MAG TPA: hypothetical protein VJP76_00615, partial [Candidatus Tumulicola sp.]|nr:hypothetical protein [Candidatus Tumulicola sp.]
MNAALRGIFFAGAAVALSGCMVPQIASGVREYLADPQQTRIVEQTVVMRLRKAGPELRIGPVECAQTPFARSAGICTVPVDGRPISVALRYDEDRHREVAEMRAAVVRTSVTVRSIETGAWIAYRVRGRAACGSAPVRVEPVGASMKCTLVTSDGRRHDVRLRIDARLTPHAVIVLPAGFARVAAVERPLRRLERAFHADPAR